MANGNLPCAPLVSGAGIILFTPLDTAALSSCSCYDTCKPDTKPTMPACSTTKTTSTTSSTITPPPPVTYTTITVDNCSTRTVCIDYVNECGIWYGG